MHPARTPFAVRIERARSTFRVVATSNDGEGPTLVEATFSGGDDGVWFRLVQQGQSVTFAREAVSRHRPLSAILRLIADEVDLARHPNEVWLASLFQSLYLYVARMTTEVPMPRWGRVIREPRVERALELLERDLARCWSVELLARAVGLSRPSFARHFARAMQLSPMQYLTQRRMQRAAALLGDSDASLSEVAARVGYTSEFAFGRAFKRHHHVAPGTYRRQVLAPTAWLAHAA